MQRAVIAAFQDHDFILCNVKGPDIAGHDMNPRAKIEIIEKIADTVRNRYKFQGKLRGLTAEGRMSSYVVGALPWVSLVMGMISNRDYTMILFTNPLGNYVLAYALGSWLFGFFLMSRMMKVTI